MGRAVTVRVYGQAPGSRGDPDAPAFAGSARFEELAGVEITELIEAWGWQFVNLLPDYPGRAVGERGDAFPIAAARTRARMFGETWQPGDRVLLCGRNVARSFHLERLPYLHWKPLTLREPRIRIAVMPHPSGVNRWWNDPQNRRAATEFVRELITQTTQVESEIEMR